MKLLKTILGVQAAVILYLFWENTTLKDQIVESADAVSKSTKRIERLSDEVEAARRALSSCRYEVNKYNDPQLIEQQDNNGS